MKTSIANISDAIDMQQDLLRFEAYCPYDRQDINVAKCFSLSFTRKPDGGGSIKLPHMFASFIVFIYFR